MDSSLSDMDFVAILTLLTRSHLYALPNSAFSTHYSLVAILSACYKLVAIFLLYEFGFSNLLLINSWLSLRARNLAFHTHYRLVAISLRYELVAISTMNELVSTSTCCGLIATSMHYGIVRLSLSTMLLVYNPDQK